MRDDLRKQLAAKIEEICPYGEPPDIKPVSDTEWLINGKSKAESPRDCTIILAVADACGTCPLNPANLPERDPPSAFLSHVIYLQNLEAIGVRFRLDDLDPMEVKALILVKGEQQADSMKRMKR